MMKKRKKYKKLIKTLLVMSLFVGFLVFLDLYKANITFKEEIKDLTSIKLYDNNNEVFYEIYNQHESTYVKIEDISQKALDTFINIEDKRFFKHSGFDIYSIIRAFINNLKNQSIIGGSTITQQYVKNIYLSNEKSYIRKTREIYYAIKMESIYSKQEILEGYLNSIYFNHGIYGIYDASKYYFNIEPKDLSLAQAAVLVAIIKAPAKYAPDVNPDKNKERKELILNYLFSEGIISETEHLIALNERITITKTKYQHYNPTTLYYKDYVLKEVKEMNIKSKQLAIYTNYNRQLNQYLSNILFKSDINSDLGLIVQDNKGRIIALLGNFSYKGYNVVTDGNRMIGSTIKPMLYYEALKKGFTPLTTFLSQHQTLYIDGDAYTIKNYNNKYENQDITLAYALATSDNVYAIKTHLFIKSDKLIGFLKKFKITKIDDYPSLALGTLNLNLLKLTSIYNTFANLGNYYNPSSIKEIRQNNRVLYINQDKHQALLDPSYCYIINELLTGTFDTNLNHVNQVTGTMISSELLPKCAAKTGTTDYDSYMIGFTPLFTVGIWTGNIDNTPLTNSDAKKFPKILFKNIINFLGSENKNIWYQKPNDVFLEFVDPTGFKTGYQKLLPFKIN